MSCTAPARAEFERALALLHHMTYPEAQAAFRRVATLDPDCAMAHWGVAMTLFQPLWPTRPSPQALHEGWASVQRAQELRPPSERERLFVAAVAAFFREPSSSDYWARIRRWEEAAEKVHFTYPDDPEAATFFALAHLATTPANVVSREHADRAAGILLRVYQRYPEHPGAMHYLVHANDVPGRERELLEVTRKYEEIAPRNPHALHMPTHIYTRLGDWQAAARGNVKAAEAALEHPAGEDGQYVWDEFAHALEYLVYAELQQGADDAAAAQLARLRATANLEPNFKSAFHLASTPARFALERRAWDEAARIELRQPPQLDWERFRWPEAVAQFARGLGAAHLDRPADARTAVARLEALEAATRAQGEELFARQIRILRLELDGWIAHAAGQREASERLLREAAELETSTPKPAVTPAPTLPAHELLGDLLLAQQRPSEALAAYRRALELYPRRFNGLLGAARAARATGDDELARGYYRDLLAVAAEGTRQPELTEAASFTRTP